MKDYALEIKIKNNFLLTMMRRHGLNTAAELAVATREQHNEEQMIKNTPDKEDRKLLAGKSASYITGWNKVKHRGDKHGLERDTAPVEGTAPRKARNRNPAKGADSAP